MNRSSAGKLVQLGLTLGITLALTFALTASSASAPVLNLGPITVADGTATVAGTVDTGAGQNQLTINGQPVGVDGAGTFSSLVNLNGASALDFQLTGAGGNQQVAFEVPLTGTLLGPGGVIPPGVLDSVQQAGLSLLAPVTGLTGQPITVSGGVLDSSNVAGLSVNGADVLDKLAQDGSFSVEVPGTTKVISVHLIDKQGVSETRTTVLQTQSVSAARAVGVRIAKIRFITRGAARTHRVRMVITVKDRLGRLVRGAKISVSAKHRSLSRSPKATRSGRKGKATIGLRVRPSALGKRLVVVVVAKTPKAKARKTSSVRLPRRHG